MRLNDSYLGVHFEMHPLLKQKFLTSHLSDKAKVDVDEMFATKDEGGIYYDKRIGNDWWGNRVEIANQLCASPKNLKVFLLTKAVQELASHVNVEKVDLKWFKQITNKSAIFILDKDNFYRFDKTDTRVNILNYRRIAPDYVVYDAYSIILDDGILGINQYQNREQATTFIQLLLFIELGEITTQVLRAKGGKVVFGKGGDDKVKNDTGLEVQLINSTWNRITIVQGGFTVRQHLRIQPCGKGRTDYRMVWVSAYTKQSYIRGAGKNITHNLKQQQK
jgi:hypothetical protein